ncbi:MAG TPA: sulfatase-like hydrolase/transferase [Xanthobacteraceae bacterium]|nr:sulfatase-like hydrolase/transferase [Xanthobacteraceae bacterium]
MRAAFRFSPNRVAAAAIFAQNSLWRRALVVLPNLIALAILISTEGRFVEVVAFLFAWGILNFFWLALLRRPVAAGVLSLVMMSVLVLLSDLKYHVLLMSANFVDLMIVDTDTVSFLFTIFPALRWMVALSIVALVPIVVLAWRFDPFRVRRLTAAAALLSCLAGLTVLEMNIPMQPSEGFYAGNEVSRFARSGVDAISELMTHGLMESDAFAADRLQPVGDHACRPAERPPHIILIHDESSFDIRMAPGIKVPEGYGAHFHSFDGKERNFLVEGAGGPSWYTEYNVLEGLSARSFGRFSYFVTRIAAGRVERGLPAALRRCGYRTFSLYPALGAFMSARSYQTTTGVQHFFDQHDLGTSDIEPDSFFFDAAAKMIGKEHARSPMFVFVYLAANHFPWDFRYRPGLMPQWKDLGNVPPVDEYLRRQALSAQNYSEFLGRLKREFPDDSFLIVRFGDHQPDFASHLIQPGLDDAGIERRLMAWDPRYFTTYYAIDAVNFKPVDVSSALDTLEGPYLPLVVQEAAGLPLDPSFVEQKKILSRCNGLFYGCANGAEARHFNRMLIDAGFIKNL